MHLNKMKDLKVVQCKQHMGIEQKNFVPAKQAHTLPRISVNVSFVKP